jgi:LmbE family N-acetylglucosaminyl deacetylase
LKKGRFMGRALVGLVALFGLPCLAAAQDATPLRQADERYKADILLVVAHPDDEAAATPYLARALDEGKRVAVAYGTRGSSGENQEGTEQAAALGDIREIEARRSLASFGITNVWFIGGKDTASQDVLQSLANWDHGAALEKLVRIVRLTRPEVVLTFLPGTFIGEDHGDHQASGVLATEAFDLAGDATLFPSQVAAPLRRLEPYLENLRPWQPKKIYYFPDADRDDLFRDKGPAYSVKDIAKSSKKAYWRLALEGFLAHKTQAKGYIERISKMSDAEIEKLAQTDGWGESQHFVRGKSLVGGSVTGDMFEGITPDAIPFARPEISPEPQHAGLSVELAGPWDFYAQFRRVHGLTQLPHPEPPEIALQLGTTLVIPLWVRNQTASVQEFTLAVDLPAGWTVQSGTGKFRVAAKQTGSARVEIDLPPLTGNAPRKLDVQEITVRAESQGQSIGVAKLRVEPRKRALPE